MIKVIIDQLCQPDKEAHFNDLLLELREMAMRQHGYISGETFRELIDPSHFKIISTWSTLEDWKTWQNSPPRVLIEAMMESMTTDGRKLRIFTVDHGSE
jgi:heme-degrading monooxygenase HmoA